MPYFDRRRPAPQVSGGYASFRPYVREDFCRRCAYCLLHERWTAGVENFELDHFRPKSRFPLLAKDFYNLYWACHPCNHMKLDIWPPAALEAKGIGFVDLCTEEFFAHFEYMEDGHWKGLTPSGQYTIDKLRLNRGHLVDLRRMLTGLGIDIYKKSKTATS